jgi:hypothetical protein
MDGIKKTFGFRAIEFLYQLTAQKGKLLSRLLGSCFNEDTPFDFPGLYVALHPSGFSTVCMLATVISGNLCDKSSFVLD